MIGLATHGKLVRAKRTDVAAYFENIVQEHQMFITEQAHNMVAGVVDRIADGDPTPELEDDNLEDVTEKPKRKGRKAQADDDGNDEIF